MVRDADSFLRDIVASQLTLEESQLGAQQPNPPTGIVIRDAGIGVHLRIRVCSRVTRSTGARAVLIRTHGLERFSPIRQRLRHSNALSVCVLGTVGVGFDGIAELEEQRSSLLSEGGGLQVLPGVDGVLQRGAKVIILQGFHAELGF